MCVVCGEGLTPRCHRLRKLMGCSQLCSPACAGCAGKDIPHQESRMVMWCVERGHEVPRPDAVLQSLVATGHMSASQAHTWQQRRDEVRSAIDAEAVRRALRVAAGGAGPSVGAPGASAPTDAGLGELEGVDVEGGQKAKRCTVCGIACVKVDGCNQVSCTLCGTEFRWCCLARGTECGCEEDEEYY